MKKLYPLLGAFLVAGILTILSPMLSPKPIEASVSATFDSENAIIPQKVLQTTKEEQVYYVVYDQDQLIGVLSDPKKLDALLERVYHEQYETEFPNSKLGVGENVHISEELCFFTYENKDDEILNYIEEHDLFSVEANKITFSNGEVMYVRNIDDFLAARDSFALTFIDQEAYETLKAGNTIPELSDSEYGTRVKNAGFKEDMSVSKGLAPVQQIAKSKEEALQILSYGYDAEKIEYTTKEYDTVKGIAWLHNISVRHLLSLNQDVLVSEQQLLKVGTVLNVTPLNSPVHFEVVMENQVEEEVYPNETEIIYDDNLREGMEYIETKQELGFENARYQETFVNGQSTGEGIKISSVITKQPIREVKHVGTKVYPHIGSGHFRWPVEVVSISCGWYCYDGHQATDVQNRYNFYGQVLASDRGVVIENSYTGINGYYMIIDHNNGYVTYYGHMSSPGFFAVGTTVQQGEPIGNIGMTGMATGPHVHFEIRYNGVRLDPETVVGK